MTSLIFLIILSIKICLVVSIEKKGRIKREKPKKKNELLTKELFLKKRESRKF